MLPKPEIESPQSAWTVPQLELEARRMRAAALTGYLKHAVAGLSALRRSLAARLHRWAVREATYRELVTLDDRMLADLGLHRGDLPFVAAAAANGERTPANRNTPSIAA